MPENRIQEHRLEGLEQLGYGPSYKETLCSMLEQSQMFSDLERKEIELLSEFVHAYRAPPGTVLFHEGKRDSYLCLLVEGRLDVMKEAEERVRRRLATIRAGKTIGEMSLIDDLPHSATVVATTEVTVLVLAKNNLLRIAEQHAHLGFKIIWKIATLLSHRLRQTSGMLVDRLD